MEYTDVDKLKGRQPSLKNLTVKNYGRPGAEQNKFLQQMTRPHVESFNYMLTEGLTDAVQDILVEFESTTGQQISLFVKGVTIYPPMVSTGKPLYPTECRERGVTYSGRIMIRIGWKVNNDQQMPLDRYIGQVPIMVKSSLCHLAKMKPSQLIEHGEEAEEMGGYFIQNGIERVVRMLVMQRRNFPLAMVRSSWKNRGPHYTEFGVQMRCVKSDQTSSTIVLHYLSNGTAYLSFTYHKRQYLAPVILVLKALKSECDKYMFDRLIDGRHDDTYYRGCIENMLRQAQLEGKASRQKVLGHIGDIFRHSLQAPDWYNDAEVARFLIKNCVCIHLDNNNDKFDMLIYMIQKLFALAKGKCAVESCDNPMFQEVLLGGHLYQLVLKERIEFWLKSLKRAILEEAVRVSRGKGFEVHIEPGIVAKALNRAGDITSAMESMLATGSIKNSESGLGLMQEAGLTVVADKLNFCRFLSHFRCIHRGSFFTEMRTTTVRKLLPEAWGFLCPVHTPDGGPCGLLNHATAMCKVVNKVIDSRPIPRLLCTLGMIPFDEDGMAAMLSSLNCYTVLLDGRVIGKVKDEDAKKFITSLRRLKVTESEGLSSMMEVCFVPKTPAASQFPGIYLFTTVARLMRPVINYALKSIEMVGTFEQVYLNICITPDEAYKGVTTHQEIAAHAMLSDMAILTPFSDYNQSPRNMYQCQMGKQTMGTPLHAITHRSDNKIYRIQTPQSPIVRPYLHDDLDLDNYPLGTNAVVAVISYTGYDMEDAMVLNKASYERGFAHGSIYKGQFLDLKEVSSKRGVDVNKLEFGRIPNLDDYRSASQHGRLCTKLEQLDLDGLPFVGAYLEEGDALYSYYNAESHSFLVESYKGSEPAYVDQVKMLFDDIGEKKFRVSDVTARSDRVVRVFIMLRIQRNPTIGDKFSSRHGQKGICSRKVPMEDMPFTESGMTPDIIFNPHGFPSRMTIGMLIEFMAGKSAALNGCCYDATPFTYTEEDDPISYFGECLKKVGYNYYGTERMYSGTNGRELEVDIFIGVVYYQRLRHMVYDKYQVRTTGAYDQITKQPVHGRKKGGGIRLGEMERDSIISHGASFLLQDRLFNCSDGSEVRACTKCGSLLSPVLDRPADLTEAASVTATRRWRCRLCGQADTVVKVRVPQVFTYLVAELASVNINTFLTVKPE